jgi:hypothetical protein
MKYPRQPGFIGFNGDSVWLKPEGFQDDDPVVVAHPDMFTDTPPPGIEAPKPKRRALKKTEPEPAKTATPRRTDDA